MSEPAPVDRLVMARSSDPSVAGVQAEAVIPAGTLTAQFSVLALSPGVAEVEVVDDAGSLRALSRVFVSPLLLSPDALTMRINDTAIMRVRRGTADADDLVVTLFATAPAQVPAQVIIPTGFAAADFVVFSGEIAGTGLVTATSSVGTDSAEVTVSSDGALALSLSPNPLNMLTETTAPMTLGLSEAAPAGGLTVALSTTGGLITVPATVSVPEGAVTLPFDVSSGPLPGSDQIIAAASGYTGESAAVIVSSDSGEVVCANLVRDVAAVTREYAKAARSVTRACRVPGRACNDATQRATDTLALLASAHQAMLDACR